ncbi:MAG TPA: peptidylprolyl isomerase, partial [Chitinophagales bacterium]|nr:peptidylprolyl isomerase [Chitinophagales bacterium]
WSEMVNNIIFDNIYNKLGINVTPNEMTELVMGANASPMVTQNQQFRNRQTGQFDPSLVRMYLSNLDHDPQGVEPGTLRKRWVSFETYLKQSQFEAKYTNLVAKGFYAPKWLAEMNYKDQGRYANFKYVQLPYSEVNDADIKVTDEEMDNYIKSHAALYKQDEETRRIAYVTFDISASAADSQQVLQYLDGKRADFAKAEKAEDVQSFLKLYSEKPFDEAYYTKEKLVSPVKDSLFAYPVGTVVGPYVDNGSFVLAKVVNKKMISDSVRVRDIKISFAGVNTQEAANEKFLLIDSIYKAIDSLHGDFAQFAATYSDDPVSKLRGGDLGWVKQNEKDQALNDTIFYRAVKGKLYKVPSQTENAIHIIQVVDDKPTDLALQVAYLSKEIVPSPETEKHIYSQASVFASDNQSVDKFTAAGQKMNIKTVASLAKDAYSVEGLEGSAREIVTWAYKASKGVVSPVFTVGQQNVVAVLEDIRPKGLPELSSIREVVNAAVVKQKKVELLEKKITDAKAASVDDLAGKLGKVASEADHVSFSSPRINGQFEPAVAAAALATPAGKLSGPVEGKSGVFAVQTLSIDEPAKTDDYSMMAAQMQQQLEGKARYAQDVEKKLATIQDNRIDFF